MSVLMLLKDSVRRRLGESNLLPTFLAAMFRLQWKDSVKGTNRSGQRPFSDIAHDNVKDQQKKKTSLRCRHFPWNAFQRELYKFDSDIERDLKSKLNNAVNSYFFFKNDVGW
ncbi:hypothetical protein DTO166G4_1163 [Paecilomyces variotii]|nr:hypothetical protein DTO166G4_1163 [Paecilomyces variotii]KAJ9317949.1 hypothetical protein DTO271D3_1654 [Paecilomyces variotii]